MKNEIVFQRAYRILRSLENYRHFPDEQVDLPAFLQEISFQEEERLVGLYENIPGEKQGCIVVTNLGLHLLSGDAVMFLAYEQMKRIAPPEDKGIDHLDIELESGKAVPILVKGGEGRFRDAFEFMRFLDRAVNDVKKSL